MSRFSFRLYVPALVCSAALGCGGAPPAPPASAPTATASAAAPSAVVAAPSGRRIPSADVLRYWPFEARPTATLYADVGGLLHTDLGRSVVPAALTIAQGSLSEAEAKCLRGSADSVKDLLFGADASGAGMLIAGFDDASFDPAPCLIAQGARPIALPGAPHALQVEDSVIVQEPGLLLVGPEASMKLALTPRTTTPVFPADLALAPNDFVAWSATIDQNALHGTVYASNERFRVGVDAQVSEADAKDAEQAFLAVQQKKLEIPGIKGQEAVMLGKLLQFVTLTRKGSQLSAALDFKEPPPEQARDLGLVTALSVYGVRKYLVEAKTAEARISLGEIAREYTVWAQAPLGKGQPALRLTSLPPVPADVPKGKRYVSTAADWKAWQALGFHMEIPQYYQYEVRAAKDGRSADIIARGDLDGDGKQSEFRLHLKLGKTLEVSPAIDEHDAEQ